MLRMRPGRQCVTATSEEIPEGFHEMRQAVQRCWNCSERGIGAAPVMSRIFTVER